MNCIEKQKRIKATQVKNTTKTKQNKIVYTENYHTKIHTYKHK